MNQDTNKFTCIVCKKAFDGTEGTWLPIGVSNSNFMKDITPVGVLSPSIFAFDYQEPEVITSPDFTCYDCAP